MFITQIGPLDMGGGIWYHFVVSHQPCILTAENFEIHTWELFLNVDQQVSVCIQFAISNLCVDPNNLGWLLGFL